MKQYEAWEIAYRRDRYLRDASISALQQRYQDIDLNSMDVNDEGKMGPIPSSFWWEMRTHIFEELTLRNLPYNNIMDESPDLFNWVSYPEPPRGIRILGKSKNMPRGIVRIGKSQHIKDAMNYGRFRIVPAASYSDPSLNPAI
jgi:hypothetical protein